MLFSQAGGRTARVRFVAPAVGAAVACAVLAPWPVRVHPQVGGDRVSVGAVTARVSLIGAALAQAPESVVVEDIRAEQAGQTLRVPRVELTGLSMSRAELVALFDGTSPEPLPSRLARVSAQRIAIPEAIWEQKIGAGRSVATYRNVLATDVRNGRIARVTTEAASTEVVGIPNNNGSTTIGRMTTEDLDAPGLAGIYLGRPDAATVPLARLHGLSVAEGMTFSGPDGVAMRVDRLSARDFFARPTAEGWMGAIGDAMAIRDPDNPSPEDTKRAFRFIGDLFGSMDFGSAEATGIEVRSTATAEPVTVTIARMAYEGATAGRSADFRLENLSFAGKDGGGRIGLLAFTGFSMASTVEAMKALADVPPDEIRPDQFRKLIPTLGTVRMADIAVDVAGAVDPATPRPERVRFGVRSAEVTADRPINGIPTRFATTVDGVTFPLPAGSADDSVRRLAAMGYRDLDLSFASAADWIESASELQIRDLSFRGRNMGGVSVRATLGNLTRDAFDPDQAVAAVALLGATARSVELTVEDKGLAERLVAQEARGRRVSPEEVRREYGVAAAVGVPALLGNSPQAKAIAQAIARFAAKPGRLVISAKAKDPAGLGAADLAALTDPTAVLERLDISARAE